MWCSGQWARRERPQLGFPHRDGLGRGDAGFRHWEPRAPLGDLAMSSGPGGWAQSLEKQDCAHSTSRDGDVWSRRSQLSTPRCRTQAPWVMRATPQQPPANQLLPSARSAPDGGLPEGAGVCGRSSARGCPPGPCHPHSRALACPQPSHTRTLTPEPPAGPWADHALLTPPLCTDPSQCLPPSPAPAQLLTLPLLVSSTCCDRLGVPPRAGTLAASPITAAPSHMALPFPSPHHAVSSPRGAVPLPGLCAHLHGAWVGAGAQDPNV